MGRPRRSGWRSSNAGVQTVAWMMLLCLQDRAARAIEPHAAAQWMHRKRNALRTYLAACVLSVCNWASAPGAPSAAAVRYQFAASAGSGLMPTAPSWVRNAGS
jgi:hypothetical protein